MRFVRGTGAAAVALVVSAAFGGSASARGVVVEDWLGSSGLGWQAGSATDFLGWSSASSDSSFSFAQSDALGRRALASEVQFLPQQGLGTGEWRFRAPGTSTVTKAEYGPAYFTREGCLNEGMRLANGSWQATRNARQGDALAASVHPTACGANDTVTGAKVVTKDGSSAVTITGAPDSQTFCSTAGCGTEGSPTGNQAVFGAERIKQGRPGFSVVLPGARLTLTDYDAPKLVSGENSHPRWVRSAKGEVTLEATDTGLGVKSAAVTHAGVSGDATSSQTHPCSGDRTDRCPATWNAAQLVWTTTWPYDTDEMPEGVQPYGVAVRDIVDNRTPDSGYDTTLVPPSKIDRSDPTGITGTGQIPDIDNTWFLGNDTRTITATAHDTYSGVKSIQIETTDGTVLDAATFSCPDDQCPRDASTTLSVNTPELPEGITTVRVRATDLVGNTSTAGAWKLKIDRTAPEVPVPGGTLSDVRDSFVDGVGSLPLTVAGADGLSGVAKVWVELDGASVYAADSACLPTGCPTWVTPTFDVALQTLTPGWHEIRVVTRDQVGHERSAATFRFAIDRDPPSVSLSAGISPAYSEESGSPEPYGIDGDDEFNIDATDADSGVASLTIRIDGAVWHSAGGNCPSPTRCDNAASWSVPLTAVSLSEGVHRVSVTVTDGVGAPTERHTASVEFDIERVEQQTLDPVPTQDETPPPAGNGDSLNEIEEIEEALPLGFEEEPLDGPRADSAQIVQRAANDNPNGLGEIVAGRSVSVLGDNTLPTVGVGLTNGAPTREIVITVSNPGTVDARLPCYGPSDTFRIMTRFTNVLQASGVRQYRLTVTNDGQDTLCVEPGSGGTIDRFSPMAGQTLPVFQGS